MNYLYLLICTLCFNANTFSQIISFDWASTDSLVLTTSDNDLPDVLIDSTGNPIVISSTNLNIYTAFSTTKVNAQGELLWQRFYDTTFGLDVIESAVTDQQENIYVAGNVLSSLSGGYASTIIKYAPNGDTLWQYFYEAQIPTINSSTQKILLTPEQNIILLGNYYDAATNTGGLIISCISPDKEVLWKVEGASGGALDIRQIEDRYYVWARVAVESNQIGFGCWQISLGGEILDYNYTEAYSDDFRDYYHTDRIGNFLVGDGAGSYKVSSFSPEGTTNFFYSLPDYPLVSGRTRARMANIRDDDDGNYYCMGVYDEVVGNDTIWLVNRVTKLNPQGQVIWEHIHFFNDNLGLDLTTPRDAEWINSDFLLTVGARSIDQSINRSNYYFMLFDMQGFVHAEMFYSPNQTYIPYNLTTKDSSVFVVGSTSPQPSGRFLHKHTIHLSQISSTLQPLSASLLPLTIVPNPSNEKAAIVLNWAESNTPGLIAVYGSDGRCISTESVQIQQGEQTLPIHHAHSLAPGQYMVSLQVGDGYYSSKWVKQ